MFDALLKSKFYSKCKSTIKLTKTRLDMIRKKRNAMQRYLKNDIADLLKTRLDVNAYGRAEGLLVELNLSSCYDLLDQYCAHISGHLAIMYKQRECPEDCREAVSSLIFAAARFADLPELRELRTIFTGRYGNSLEYYVNKELVEKLKSALPAKEMKLQLMQDIAAEFEIEWDSKALEQKLFKPPVSEQDWSKIHDNEDHKLHKITDESAQEKESGVAKLNQDTERQLTTPMKKTEHHSSNDGKEVPGDEHSLPMQRKSDIRESMNLSRSSRKSVDTPLVKTIDTPPVKTIDANDAGTEALQNKPATLRIVSEEVSDDKKPFGYRSICPPYTKSRVSITKGTSDASPGSTAVVHEHSEMRAPVAKQENNCKDDAVEKTKPKPKSVRRRRAQPPPCHEDLDSPKVEERMKACASEVTEDAAHKHGTKVTIGNDHDHCDAEEKIMDTLLMHYNTKQLQNDIKRPESASTVKPAAVSIGEVSRWRSRDGPSGRTASLPVELEQTSPGELNKGHVRANSSLQPDILSSNGHVHPKLPDYDDFVARLASLRAKTKEERM